MYQLLSIPDGKQKCLPVAPRHAPRSKFGGAGSGRGNTGPKPTNSPILRGLPVHVSFEEIGADGIVVKRRTTRRGMQTSVGTARRPGN